MHLQHHQLHGGIRILCILLGTLDSYRGIVRGNRAYDIKTRVLTLRNVVAIFGTLVVDEDNCRFISSTKGVISTTLWFLSCGKVTITGPGIHSTYGS
jgi:hypothetical protein